MVCTAVKVGVKEEIVARAPRLHKKHQNHNNNTNFNTQPMEPDNKISKLVHSCYFFILLDLIFVRSEVTMHLYDVFCIDKKFSCLAFQFSSY